jgi:hypothetical protein
MQQGCCSALLFPAATNERGPSLPMLAGSGELAVQQAGHQQGGERHQQQQIGGLKKAQGGVAAVSTVDIAEA